MEPFVRYDMLPDISIRTGSWVIDPYPYMEFFPNFPAGFVDMMIGSSRNKRLRKKEGLLLLLCRSIATESD